ncbi:MAG TPA: efflux transporter outer membrane subunit [Macromonas sp.]|nr:efflux transporter outer membrane subunit [Macromonas sp.]
MKNKLQFPPSFRVGLRAPAVLAVLGVLSACSQLPTYTRPEVALPASWATENPSPVANGSQAADLSWQGFVQDAQLRRLVQAALDNNRDLRVAVLQIEQARAQYQVRSADAWPTVQAGLAGSRATTGKNEPIESTYRAGLLVTSWELDLFGRIASLKEAAQAQFLATQEARKAVQVSLVAAVANGWFNLQASEAQLKLAQDTWRTRQDSLRLTRLRFDNGAASAVELRTAESLEATARAAVAQQARQRQQDINALTLLVGQAPNRSLDVSGAVTTLGPDAAQALAGVPVGLPSQVLLRRPDVLNAEQQLVSSNAQIGAARAAFFPQISLTTSLGSASSELSGLFKSGSWGWTLAPQALLPIFDAGRNQANLDAAKVGRDIALARYEKAIQTAFKEVNDALVGVATLDGQLKAQEDLVRSETERLRLTELRTQQGVASQLEYLDAQRSLFSAQQAVLQARLAQAQGQVALYQALGGGWQSASGRQ